MSEEKALVKAENKSISQFNNKIMPKLTDNAKRIGSIVGQTGIALVSLATGAVIGGPAIAVGLGVGVAAQTKALKGVIYKREPGLMFVTRKAGDEVKIFQDVKMSQFAKIKDYSSIEKGGMMALQTLVGFERYKKNLQFSDYEVGENGEKIYMQKYSTVTHGINIKTMEMLDELGYIKIESVEDKFKQTPLGKLMGKEPKGMKNLLIPEKIGFGNYEDLKKIAKAAFTGDKETLNKMKKSFSKVTFRLTDKEINFQELYEKVNNLENVTDKNERMALRRLSAIFGEKQGVISTRNLDIDNDRYGRPILKYNTKEPFVSKYGLKDEQLVKNEKNKFKEDLQRDVNAKDLEKRALRNLEVKKENEFKEFKDENKERD